MTNLINEETLHIDYPDISESAILNYKLVKDDIGRLCFKFYVESGNSFIYDEVITIGGDDNDYHIVSDTSNPLLISAIRNTISYLVHEHA